MESDDPDAAHRANLALYRIQTASQETTDVHGRKRLPRAQERVAFQMYIRLAQDGLFNDRRPLETHNYEVRKDTLSSTLCKAVFGDMETYNYINHFFDKDKERLEIKSNTSKRAAKKLEHLAEPAESLDLYTCK